jgi:alpha-L-fucosidase
VNNKINAWLILSIIFSLSTFAQTAGDEDKEMFNRGRARDKAAIDEAVNGWWTASMKNHDERVAWWREARFGMFIHWGIYSLPGGEWKGKKVDGYAEHLMRKEKIPRAEYLELAHRFNPTRFNADQWVRLAKQAGMKYLIITSKHHDGFAMFDSDVSDYNVVKQTAWKHDPMKDLSAACKRYGIKFGFYYSHAFDWEHPDAPGNDWEYNNPGGDKGLFGGVNWFDLHPELLPKAQRYVREKAIPQIKELIAKYHPDILWFDTPSKLPLSENIEVLKAIREADLTVVVNGRLVRGSAINFGDYKNTADRPAEFFPVTGDWEAIPTTNESYGYSKFDSSHKPVSHFIRLMANAASRGGNLLMNIGPEGNGSIDPRDTAILQGIGRWMQVNAESIYGTGAGPLPFQSWGASTRKGDKLYLHVFDRPADGKLYVGGLESTPANAYFLAEPAKRLPFKRINDKDIVIQLPARLPDSANTVIVLTLKNDLRTDSIRYVSSNIESTRLLAFDANLQGNGFSFGDGKTDRYYVEGWKDKTQYVSWRFRTGSATTFKVLIKYLAGEESGGSYRFEEDGQDSGEKTVRVSKGVITEELGLWPTAAGTHSLAIKPVSITKGSLMKLLEVQLVPVK